MLFDISIPLSGNIITWPKDPKPTFTKIADLAKGNDNTVSVMRLCVHAATHIDAPAHYFQNGAGVDRIPLDLLVGEACVVDMGDADMITAEVCETLTLPADTTRLLFKTRNSALLGKAPVFAKKFAALTDGAAEWIVERGIRLVGIDYLSIASYKDINSVHKILLSKDVVALEGLDLRRVTPDVYELICMPLKIAGCDGAPARAILRNIKDC
ncbi:MAG: cyclase family protein [Chitinivibrionales bacterium]|nr:cyclase family protein [Chitinivibrionales bacterium]